MLKKLLFVILLSSISAMGQHLSFEYDAAGNQVKRELVMTSGRPSNTASDSIADVVTPELKKFFPGDEISYYPNPVNTELFLKWENKDTASVIEVSVYDMAGHALQHFTNLKGIDSQTIPFGSLPQGIYNVVLVYSSSDTKAIKIIKK